MDFNYGKTQYICSERMRKSPFISKMVNTIFGYTNIGNYARSRVFIKLLNMLPLASFKNIADLGAGLGEFTFMMAESLPKTQFTAIEILPERVEKLNEVVYKLHLNNVTIFPETIDKLETKAKFDFIFAVDVFEHAV
jgi:16S rRNA G527 N7-methylase RsmG